MNEFDVVVVGAGLAGHVAALVAGDAGATACVLEKQPEYGGSSVLAGGGLLFAGTDLQRRAGVEDDPQRLREAIFDAGGQHNDPRVVDAYIRHQLAAYRWLAGKGLRFSLAPPNANMPVARLHVADGDFVAALHEHLECAPRVTYRPETPADRLVRDRDDRVRAVRTADGALIRARRGVVLTTGGFSRSGELVRTFAPRLAAAARMGGAGNTGDGLRMATGLGARLADIGWLEPTFGASIEDTPRLLFAHADGAVVVNRAGERFADESLSYKVLGRVCSGQPAGLAFQIFDDTVMARSRPKPTPRDYQGALAEGLVVSAATVPGLAQCLGIAPGALETTISRYNEFVRAGADSDFGRPVGAGVPAGGAVAVPPFYGFPCRAGLTATYGGIGVDEHLVVHDVFGQPIPGLFAAGEVVGGFHGAGYLTGTGLGKAAVFGYLAGLGVVGGRR